MQTQSDAGTVSYGNWTLRVRPASMQPQRLLLLLHGWTGDENSMWVFVRNFPSSFWIVAPRAPHTTQPGGYSWRPYGGMNPPPDQVNDTVRASVHNWPGLADLRPSAESLIQFVDAYAADNRIDAGRFDVMGFSQGAALANVLAFLHPGRIHRACILSGFVPVDAEPLVRDRPLEGIPFFVAHGTQDDMVDIGYARRSVQILEQAGARVDFHEEDVGHKVGANSMRALESFFTA